MIHSTGKRSAQRIGRPHQFHRIGLLLFALLLILKLDSSDQVGASPTRGSHFQLVSGSGSTGAGSNNNEQLQHNPASRIAASWYLNNLRFRRHTPTASQHTDKRPIQSSEADGLTELRALAEAKQQQQQQQQPSGLSQLPLLLANPQLLEDEQTLRSQLPELIAQAHNDKAVERALLKMLINASLRSALGNMVGPSASSQQQSASASPLSSWLEGLTASNDGSGAMSDRLARLEQEQQLQQQNELINDPMAFANADPTNGQQFQPAANSMDKREYIKPCSFNAISCVRMPFRRT